MQCSPPFYGTGYQNFGQFYPYNPSYPHPTPYPEVIGEGEVASVVFPDGSVHFYFIPINKRNSPYSNHNPTQNPYWNNVGAYYVRSISNPMPTSVFNQQCQKMYGMPYSRPCLMSDCNSFVPPPEFQLKFHNDCWTSTTDLQYFCPRLRGRECLPIAPTKECASVQTDIPAVDQNASHQITCTKPCLCSQECNDNKESSGVEMVDDCNCNKVYRSSSVTSKSSGGKPSRLQLRKPKSKLKHKRQKQRLAKKTSNVESECRCPNTTDKAVTTYADQGSSCRAQETNTQTGQCGCGTSASIKVKSKTKADVKTNNKQNLKIKSSERLIGIFETDDSSSGSCCCSATDVGL